MKIQFTALMLSFVSLSSFAQATTVTADCTIMSTKVSTLNPFDSTAKKVKVVLEQSAKNPNFFESQTFRTQIAKKSIVLGDVSMTTSKDGKSEDLVIGLKIVEINSGGLKIVKGMAYGDSGSQSSGAMAYTQAMNLDIETIDLNNPEKSLFEKQELYKKSGSELAEVTLSCEIP
jgi:hypothetical protein